MTSDYKKNYKLNWAEKIDKLRELLGDFNCSTLERSLFFATGAFLMSKLVEKGEIPSQDAAFSILTLVTGKKVENKRKFLISVDKDYQEKLANIHGEMFEDFTIVSIVDFADSCIEKIAMSDVENVLEKFKEFLKLFRDAEMTKSLMLNEIHARTKGLVLESAQCHLKLNLSEIEKPNLECMCPDCVKERENEMNDEDINKN
jgi:hypothetical protein